MFSDGLPRYALSVHGESDGARNERAELLEAVNAAHLVTSAGEVVPHRFVTRLLKELALTTASDSPLDNFIRLRLTVLLRELWKPPASSSLRSPTGAPAPAQSFVPRAAGPLLQHSLSEVRLLYFAIYSI